MKQIKKKSTDKDRDAECWNVVYSSHFIHFWVSTIEL